MMRKNRKNKWSGMGVAAGVCAVALLFAACTDTQEPAAVNGIAVPIEIEAASLTGEVETRAADVKNLEQGSIGLYRTGDNGYTPLDNVPYSYADGKWISSDAQDNTKTVFVDHRSATLYGYYPYKATPDATGTVFNLALKRFTEDDALFYTGDIADISNRNTTLNMQLKPAYSRLTFRLKNFNLPDCVISSMTLTPTTGTFVTNGTIDIHAATPAVTAGSNTASQYEFPFVTAGDAADSIAVKGIATGQWDETMDMLWIPQSLSGFKITIQLHFNGEDVAADPTLNKTVSATIPAASLAALQPGTQHVIPLLVKGTQVNNGVVTMPTLEPVNPYDPFEENKLTSYTLPPVEVNGVYVATGNVFCYDHSVLLTKWYTFSSKSGGVFGTNSDASFTQAEVNAADPCLEVGPNWHTPTAAQLQSIQAAKVGDYTSLTDGGTTKSGWYVGVADSDTGIFLATGQYLSTDGGYLDVTSTGMNYVSSVASATTAYTVRCVSDTKY